MVNIFERLNDDLVCWYLAVFLYPSITNQLGRRVEKTRCSVCSTELQPPHCAALRRVHNCNILLEQKSNPHYLAECRQSLCVFIHPSSSRVTWAGGGWEVFSAFVGVLLSRYQSWHLLTLCKHSGVFISASSSTTQHCPHQPHHMQSCQHNFAIFSQCHRKCLSLPFTFKNLIWHFALWACKQCEFTLINNKWCVCLAKILKRPIKD